jgi:cold shock CspA family protein/ribosome-associated translation inhibitor RaiA
MQVPLQIAFRNVPHSERLSRAVEEQVARLENLYDRIVACRVVLDMPHRQHAAGNLYQVRIDLSVPGREIVVNREPNGQAEFKDLDAALTHAFDAATRQLENFMRQRKSLVKHHEPLPHARVARLVNGDEYGFILTPDGREIYFHANSLLNGDFERLAVGAEVTYVEELGEKGPQASTVKLVGRHSHL